MRYIQLTIYLILLQIHFTICNAGPLLQPARLKEAYPLTIEEASSSYILLKNGSKIHLIQPNSFFKHKQYPHETSMAIEDIQCHGVEPFLKRLYGSNEHEVKNNLTTIYWMPNRFGKLYPLKVTTINDIDKKLKHISAELEKLPSSYLKFLVNPAGSYYWRNVKNEKYLSSHSFGIAIDINSTQANYWMWDWKKAGRPQGRLTFHNRIPMQIVNIFEKEGFIWGGRWYYYDTMHFEYRPELFLKTSNTDLSYNTELGTYCYS